MFLTQVAAILFSIFIPNNLSNNAEVSIHGIRSKQGQIIIGVYKTQAAFEEEKAYLVKKFDKKDLQKDILVVKFNLEPGVYGFTLLDDENNNAKMEYNFVGMPKEGFGFSNYYHAGFTRPKFESFKLEVHKDLINKSKIKIRYM